MTTNQIEKYVKLITTFNREELTIDNIMSRLLLKTLNVLSFEGLPPTCYEDYIKLALIKTGEVSFYEDDKRGLIALTSSDSGSPDIYGRATYSTLVGVGYHKRAIRYTPELPDIEGCSVPVKDNMLRYPFINVISQYAKSLLLIYKAIDSNVKLTQSPLVLAGDSKQLPVIKKINSIFEAGISYMALGKNTSITDIKAFNLGVAFIADKLQQLKRDYLAEFDGLIGLNNVAHEKKEHLTINEVDANNETTDNDLLVRVNEINKGLKNVNAYFEQDIKLVIKSSKELPAEEVKEPNQEELKDEGGEEGGKDDEEA